MRINRLSLKRRLFPRFLCALATALSIPQPCQADIGVEFSGFGSIGVSRIFNDNARNELIRAAGQLDLIVMQPVRDVDAA